MIWGFPERGRPLRHAGRAICAALALSLFTPALSTPAQAKEVASATATTQAVVVAPTTIVKVQDMSFGRIVARPQPGTVTVSGATGACTVTGPILEVGTCRQAIFAGMGTKNMRARISLDSVISLTGPGQTMVLDQVFLSNDASISFTGNSNANGQGVGLTQGNGNQRYTITSNTGIFTLKIGGRLNVNANQLPGIYNGSITVTVQYQ